MAKMNPSDFVQESEVSCPFFKNREFGRRPYVTCEGAIETAELVSRFRKSSDMAKHMRKYCCKLGAYLKCPIYKIVAQKYEEEE